MEAQIKHYENKLRFEIDSWDLHQSPQQGEDITVVAPRSLEDFQREPLPGAVNIPHRTLTSQKTRSLPPKAIYVNYYDGIGCNAATRGALNLAQLAFRVKELIGGLDWWKRDGHPTEGEDAPHTSPPALADVMTERGMALRRSSRRIPTRSRISSRARRRPLNAIALRIEAVSKVRLAKCVWISRFSSLIA